eukprot:s7275_g2.t2
MLLAWIRPRAQGSSWQRATLLLGETAALDLQPDAILKSAVLTACRDAADWHMQLQHFWTSFCGCHTPSLALCNAVLDVLTAWQPALHVLGRLRLWRLRPSHAQTDLRCCHRQCYTADATDRL